MIVRCTAAAVVLSLLGGCAGMGKEDHEQLQDEVAKNVSNAMPEAVAIEHLEKAGFRCIKGNSASSIECDRMKSNILLYSCVQHAYFTVDITRQLVDKVEPVQIACSGM